MIRRKTPREVQIPWWLGLSISAFTAGGTLFGWLQRKKSFIGAGERPSPPQRATQAVFVGSGLGYLLTSLVDFWEHFRLEKEKTGRYWGFQAVPVGETINHWLTISTLLGLFASARPLPKEKMARRDWFVLLAPAIFMALGWRDELVYHRRRSVHREDMMHTVAHLAVTAMLASFYSLRVLPWNERRPYIEEVLLRALRRRQGPIPQRTGRPPQHPYTRGTN